VSHSSLGSVTAMSLPALLRCLLAATLLLSFEGALLSTAAAVSQEAPATVPSVAQFTRQGPFRAVVREDITLTLRSKERVRADFYRSEGPQRAPLVILVHGYDNSKTDHAYQGLHLATWGMHCLVLQVRTRGPWVGNGTLLMRVAQHLRANPGSLDTSIDPSRIVLAGHSFGATSVIVALAGGAPAAGAVLLDPADAIRGLPGYLRKVRSPVAILGADDRLGVTRNRRTFYANLPSNVSEVSIADARHEDAQFTLAHAAAQAEAPQLEFVGALTAAAYSLSFTGKLDQAWSSFREAAGKGTMFSLHRK